MSGVEVAVVAGAFAVFSVVPGMAAWIESRRRRAAVPAADVPAAAMPEVSEPDAPIGTVTASTVPSEPPAEPATAAPTPEPALPEEGVRILFRLDDLRHARILDAPPREMLTDPAGQEQWETGLKLAETHSEQIRAAELSAPFEPQARCFAGISDRGEVTELRFLLFADLWPTSTDQAAGAAVFEIAAGVVTASRVVVR